LINATYRKEGVMIFLVK